MKKIKFIRYGGLSPQKQIHRKERIKNNEIGYHTPPKNKGIYAFPYPYVDKFLLGASNNPSNPSGKSAWLKDENGNIIEEVETDENGEYIKTPEIKKSLKKAKVKISDLFTVKYDPFMENNNCDDDCDNCSIEKECENREVKYYFAYYKKPKIFEHKGDIWCHFKEVSTLEDIKDEFGTWIKVDYETYLKLFYLQFKEDKKELKRVINDQDIKNPYKRKGISICRDHLEVFIEKIK